MDPYTPLSGNSLHTFIVSDGTILRFLSQRFYLRQDSIPDFCAWEECVQQAQAMHLPQEIQTKFLSGNARHVFSKSGSEPVHGKVHLVAQPVGQETPRVRRAIASKSMRPVVLPLLSRVS